ncbi:MAG: DUF2190 family protein [Inquilinaceae bacterium]
MKNYIQPGNVLTVAAPAALSSGAVVAVGKLIGIAATDAALGAEVEASVEGVFAVPKTAANVVATGDQLYWNAGAGEMTTTATGNTKAGFAAAPAGAGVATVRIRLTPGAA